MIPVEQQPPMRRTKVFLLVRNALGNYRTLMAKHVVGGDYGLDPDGYITDDPEEMELVLQEGWYEVSELSEEEMIELPSDWTPVAWQNLGDLPREAIE